MLCFKTLNIFYKSICNEIDAEENFLYRINRNLNFVPVRVIKTLKYIDKFRINNFFYSLICIFLFLLFPIYFLFKIRLKINKTFFFGNVKKNLVLVADNRIESLYKKINLLDKESTTFLNINQKNKLNYVKLNNLISYKVFIKSYIYSVISLFYVLSRLSKKSNILQLYVAYDWFKTYFALEKLVPYSENIFFSNHYDRWSTMFDNLFGSKNLILIQHGVLPEDLFLSYKLKNLKTIYCFNNKSKKKFSKLFECDNTIFKTFNLRLNLTPVYSNKKTVLIIGQPHSVEREIEIIDKLKKTYTVYVKPHPLYNNSKYDIKGVELISDKEFFPKVDIALNYESTLGVEYEASGVKLLWFKEMSNQQILEKITKIIE